VPSNGFEVVPVELELKIDGKTWRTVSADPGLVEGAADHLNVEPVNVHFQERNVARVVQQIGDRNDVAAFGEGRIDRFGSATPMKKSLGAVAGRRHHKGLSGDRAFAEIPLHVLGQIREEKIGRFDAYDFQRLAVAVDDRAG